MDHIQIIKKAFNITRLYRVLWIFGILLALTAGGGGGGGGGGSSNFSAPGGGNRNRNLPDFFDDGFKWPESFETALPGEIERVGSALIALGIGLVCLILLLVTASIIVRYISETAMIRMVDSYETSGEKVGFRQGWRFGWSRAALRIFLIDLLIGIALFLAFLILFALAMAPLLVWLTEVGVLRAIGTIAAIGLGLVVIFLAVVTAIAMGIVLHIIRRACVLDGLGIWESVRSGFKKVGKRIGDVVIMAVILFALGLGYIIVMIPVFIVLLVLGLVVAGLPALLVGGMVWLILQDSTAWIVAAIVGLPVLFLVIFIPSIFIQGLVETFKSSVWTLVYRELAGAEVEGLAAG